MSGQGAGSYTSLSEFGTDAAAVAKRWRLEIELAKKDRKTWVAQVKKALKRYRDERGDRDTNVKFNVYWSNVQTLGPAIYAQAPKPVVERRFLDRDPVGRTACRILERTLVYQIEASKFHAAMKRCRDDYLHAAQGVVWLRYEPSYGPSQTAQAPLTEPNAVSADGKSAAIEGGTPEPAQEVIDENICVDFVHWSDYLTSASRIEDEVTWKGKRAFLSRDGLRKRFKKLTAEQLKAIPLDHVPNGMSSEEAGKPENELLKKATVWEIWDKDGDQVVFIAEQYGEAPLEVTKSPLGLAGFWPTPEPWIGTITNDSVVPIPDFHLYRDQIEELDNLTQRIALLTDAIRASGCYDASIPELKNLLEQGGENKLYPVDSWAAFSEKGGIIGAISFLPIKEMAETLIRLYEAREHVKSDLYEITGISDIVRGAASQTAPATATEQRIKGQFANLRLTDRQAEGARFARDTLAIMAELIAEHFDDETIRLMSGYDQWGADEHLAKIEADAQAAPMMGHNGGPPMPQEPQGAPPMAPPVPGIPLIPQPDPKALAQQAADEQFAAAMKLLRSEKLRGFRIDVETDSTIEPDQNAEKQSRVEYLTAAGQFLQSSLEIGNAQPKLVPLLGKMLLFGSRGFKSARELETALEETVDQLEKDAAAPKPQQGPSPEEEAGQIKLQILQAQLQGEQVKQASTAKAQEMADARAAQLHQMDIQKNEEVHKQRMDELARKAHLDIMNHTQSIEAHQASAAAAAQKSQADASDLALKQQYAYDSHALTVANDQHTAQHQAASLARQAVYDRLSAEQQLDHEDKKAAIQQEHMRKQGALKAKNATASG